MYYVNFVHLSVECGQSGVRFGHDKRDQEGWMSSGFAVLPGQVRNLAGKHLTISLYMNIISPSD